MKCEIKYIENNIKKDFKRITVKGILFTIIISGTLGFLFGCFFSQNAIYVFVMIIFSMVFIAVWTDAVSYCKDLKKTDNERAIS